MIDRNVLAKAITFHGEDEDVLLCPKCYGHLRYLLIELPKSIVRDEAR